MHKVVIVGGGFAGLSAALGLGGAPVEVTLIDRRNHHLFQPLLYQVAAGTLSPANISAPIRSLVARQRNVRVWMAEAVGLDAESRTLRLSDGEVKYDTLIVAAGASHSYFGRDDWAEHAPGLKSLEDATLIRRRVLTAFEAAERCHDLEARRAWLTFVVVGAGPTGVELAGAIAEMARYTLRRDFREVNPLETRILLVEAADRVLPMYSEPLSLQARYALKDLGVTVLTETRVVEVTADHVALRSAAGDQTVFTHTVLWGAGVQGSPLGKKIAEAVGSSVDRAGRVEVTPELTVPGRPEIFVLGDLSSCRASDGKTLPALAPVAIQQGRYAARVVRRRLEGRQVAPFTYSDLGSMATIGRFKAVANLRGWEFGGALAWLAWLFVHLIAIVQFQNRVLVMIQWAWHYLTWSRSARLITGPVEPTLPAKTEFPAKPEAGHD